MLTSRQSEMLEKLPYLYSKYGGIIKSFDANGEDYVVYFLYLKHKYMGENENSRSTFLEMTKVNKDIYYELCGNTQNVKQIKPKTLAQVAFGLRMSYEEAVMLFLYHGVYIFTDKPYHQAIHKVLEKLDTTDWSTKNDEGGMALLSDLDYWDVNM